MFFIFSKYLIFTILKRKHINKMIFKKFYNIIKTKLNDFNKNFPLEKLEINPNTDIKKKEFGDISINAPMILAKIKKENPVVLAKEIRDLFADNFEIEKIEIAGGGFLNFFLKDSFFKKYLFELIDQKMFFMKQQYDLNNYNIEFVSANPTGPLHIGHGRGAIIGDVLAKIMKLKGYRVTREFYINDAGSQIEKLGKSVFAMYKNFCGIESIFPEDGYHGYYIKEIAERLYKEHGNQILEKEITFFSFYAKEKLLKNIENTLLEYQVQFDVWFSEKQLHDDAMIEKAIDILDKKGFIYIADDQSIWFKSILFGDEKDRVLKKSNGEWTYTAADIAYFLNKIDRGFTKIIMILGQDHHSFKIRLEAIAAALGFDLNNFYIILYQLVTLKNEGELVRMSKRKGNSIELSTVIDVVGSDVARFFYLNKKADAHLDFNIKDALEKNTNNPVFYIQYAIVRIKSILEKAELYIDINKIKENDIEDSFQEIEKLLLKQIATLDHTLEKILLYQAPHLISYFTSELASLFHSWYNFEQIIDKENEKRTKKKLLLIKSVQDCLFICADILGIKIPDRM